MPTQLVSASVLARPVHPIFTNRQERANVAMRQGPSGAPGSWTRAWVLRTVNLPASASRLLDAWDTCFVLHLLHLVPHW